VGRTEDSRVETIIIPGPVELDFSERMSKLVRLHHLTSDRVQDERDSLIREISEWSTKEAISWYNSSKTSYDEARAEYRRYSKSERSGSANGIGSPNLLSARKRYIHTKKEFEQARYNFENHLGAVANYQREIDDDE